MFIIEKAPSRRSSCKRCKVKIQKGEQRIVALFFDVSSGQWARHSLHAPCFLAHAATEGWATIDLKLEGFHKLSDDEQKSLSEELKVNELNPANSTDTDTGIPTGPCHDVGMNVIDKCPAKSPNNCFTCKKNKFLQGETFRFGMTRPVGQHPQQQWQCYECVVKNANVLRISQFRSWKTLPYEMNHGIRTHTHEILDEKSEENIEQFLFELQDNGNTSSDPSDSDDSGSSTDDEQARPLKRRRVAADATAPLTSEK